MSTTTGRNIECHCQAAVSAWRCEGIAQIYCNEQKMIWGCRQDTKIYVIAYSQTNVPIHRLSQSSSKLCFSMVFAKEETSLKPWKRILLFYHGNKNLRKPTQILELHYTRTSARLIIMLPEHPEMHHPPPRGDSEVTKFASIRQNDLGKCVLVMVWPILLSEKGEVYFSRETTTEDSRKINISLSGFWAGTLFSASPRNVLTGPQTHSARLSTSASSFLNKFYSDCYTTGKQSLHRWEKFKTYGKQKHLLEKFKRLANKIGSAKYPGLSEKGNIHV